MRRRVAPSEMRVRETVNGTPRVGANLARTWRTHPHSRSSANGARAVDRRGNPVYAPVNAVHDGFAQRRIAPTTEGTADETRMEVGLAAQVRDGFADPAVGHRDRRIRRGRPQRGEGPSGHRAARGVRRW